MVQLLIGILLVALVWALTGALGLPYLISVVITLITALYLLGPYAGWWGERRGPGVGSRGPGPRL
ncbi:MAG: hypothetical protein M3Z95_08225 [Actinomycetota bacterium]|nr:hypothetical protein [Actinomycetota bacterium]